MSTEMKRFTVEELRSMVNRELEEEADRRLAAIYRATDAGAVKLCEWEQRDSYRTLLYRTVARGILNGRRYIGVPECITANDDNGIYWVLKDVFRVTHDMAMDAVISASPAYCMAVAARLKALTYNPQFEAAVKDLNQILPLPSSERVRDYVQKMIGRLEKGIRYVDMTKFGKGNERRERGEK